LPPRSSPRAPESPCRSSRSWWAPWSATSFTSNYTELLYRTLSLTGWLTDAIFPRSWTIRAILRQTGRYLDDIIEANSSRVAADLVERAAKSRARLESELRENLRRVTSVAESALERARRRRSEGDAAAQEELRSITLFRREVEMLLQQTEEGGNG